MTAPSVPLAWLWRPYLRRDERLPPPSSPTLWGREWGEVARMAADELLSRADATHELRVMAIRTQIAMHYGAE